MGNLATRKKKKQKSKPPAFVRVAAECSCATCAEIRRDWPTYYVGSVGLSYECWLEENAPGEMPASPPPSAAEARQNGLSIRRPLPLLSGRCDLCERLRDSKRRFCLHCESRAKRLLGASEGWTPKLVAEYLAAPKRGKDRFAETSRSVQEHFQPAAEGDGDAL